MRGPRRMPGRRPTSSAAAGVVLAALVLASPAAGAQKSEDLLRQAVVADDHVSYSGTITTVIYAATGANSTVVRVDHLAPDKWRMWYVAPADAYGRLIVSNESLTYQYEPTTATVYSDAWDQSSPGVTLELDASKVLSNYSLDDEPSVDVAGRKTVALSLVSKHSGTLVERVWLDSDTKLVLRRETYHADGTIDSKTGFDNIRIGGDLPKGLFDLTVPAGMHVEPGATYGKSTKDVTSIQSSLNFTVVSPTYLPDGFTLEKAALVNRGGVQNAEVLYTDGLRDFS